MGKVITSLLCVLLLLVIAAPIAAFKFESIRIIQYDDFLQVKVVVSSDKKIENAKVSAYVVGQDIKDSFGRFDLIGEKTANLILPEVFPGYATIRISVSADGERRTVYRFIEIE